MPKDYRPLLNFMIIGAQKCGTTALARFLGQHPHIVMTSEKEPHLFDSPDYSADWTSEQIDERYRPYFTSDADYSVGTPPFREKGEKGTPEKGTPALGQEGTPTFEEGSPIFDEKGTPTLEGTPIEGPIRGEATPIYLFLPEIAPELKRYNPNLKVIVLLRDPVERAVSHYYMEKSKGYEQLPFWLTLIWESLRLRRCGNPRRRGSAWRRHSYRRRGLYSVQLRNLFRHFDAAQVMVVRAEDLVRHHDEVLKRVFEFLEVQDYPGIQAQTVFEGARDGRRHRVVSWLLRMSFLPEFIRMRRFKIAQAPE